MSETIVDMENVDPLVENEMGSKDVLMLDEDQNFIPMGHSVPTDFG
jgi:hypothetical protein